MSTISSYDVVGVKEDIADIITNISPTATPFQSMIGSESMKQKLHQWQEDSLMAVSSTPVIEGANAPPASFQATVMRSNTTQIFTKTASTTGTMDVTETYGRSKELAYQLGLRSKELKRNLEYALVGTGQTMNAGSDTGARSFAGYQAQVNPSVVYTNGTGGGLGFTGTTPARAVITEAAVLATAQALYNAGADPNTLMVKPADSLNVAAFARGNSRTQYTEADEKKLTNVISVYESPFGTLKVVMNRFIRGANAGDATSDALIFEADMWRKLTLRNWFRQTLAKTGDATNVQILGEFSLKHRNYGASGYLTNLA